MNNATAPRPAGGWLSSRLPLLGWGGLEKVDYDQRKPRSASR